MNNKEDKLFGKKKPFLKNKIIKSNIEFTVEKTLQIGLVGFIYFVEKDQ